MSADARVARAIQQVRVLEAHRVGSVNPDVWLTVYLGAVDDLIAEVKDALHLTDSDIAQY